MSKIDLEKQRQAISRLRGELQRLNGEFGELKARMGLPADAPVEIPAGDLPAQLQKAMAEAEGRAKEAGREAVAALRCETEEAGGAKAPRARRAAIAV